MKHKALFMITVAAFLASCGGLTSSQESISKDGSEANPISSLSEKEEESSIKEEESELESKEPEKESEIKDSKESEEEKESSIPEESSEAEGEEEDYPSSERFHDAVKDYMEPSDSRYAFKPQVSKTLPRIDINEPNNQTAWATVPDRTHKWDYTDVSVTLIDENGNETADIACQAKVRGNYTANYSKKPFRLKFNKKQAMFGLNGGAKLKSWVLLADVKDAAMSRNALAFYLGKTILGSDGYYCSDFRPVELYINGQYWGVYLLAEQQQINGNRVDVDDVTDRDPSDGSDVYEGTDTGYLVEYDGYAVEEEQKADGDPTFHITYHNDGALTTKSGRQTQQLRDYMFNSGMMNGFTVKSDIVHENQLTFIGNYFENVYNLLYDAVYNGVYYEFNDDYTSTSISQTISNAQECVEKAVNVDSFVDTYIQHEICCDYDINWSSFYFSADFSENGSKKLTMEAPWDFDSALACRDAAGNGRSFYAAECQNAWMLILQNQSWFQDKVKAKWAELVENNVFHNALHYLDYYRVYYKNYYDENFTRWGRSEGSGEWRREIQRLNTQAEHSAYVYTWLSGRLNWLSSQWGDGAVVIPASNNDTTAPAKAMGNAIEAEWVSTRYETENSTRNGGTLKTSDATASNGQYIGGLDGQVGIRMTYTVTSSSAQTAFLKLGLSKRPQSGLVGDWYAFYINNEEYSPLSSLIPALANGERDYHAWTLIDAGSFPLKQGSNSIVIETLGYGTNFDYIDLFALSPLS